MVLADGLDDTSKKRLPKWLWAIVAIVIAVVVILIVGAFFISQKKESPNLVFTYDIPALIGKNIDQADKELPVAINRDSEPSSGGAERHRIYAIDKKILIINFNFNTREVISCVLDGDNKDELLEVGNLRENDAKYKIEQLNDEIGMLGIKIYPQ